MRTAPSTPPSSTLSGGCRRSGVITLAVALAFTVGCVGSVAASDAAGSGASADQDGVAGPATAGEAAGEKVWRMPLIPAFDKAIDSKFADMKNTGGRHGGAATAAAFLKRYVNDVPWAHLDIAGTAWKSGKEKGATGRPVSLLTQFLITRSGQA